MKQLILAVMAVAALTGQANAGFFHDIGDSMKPSHVGQDFKDLGDIGKDVIEDSGTALDPDANGTNDAFNNADYGDYDPMDPAKNGTNDAFDDAFGGDVDTDLLNPTNTNT